MQEGYVDHDNESELAAVAASQRDARDDCRGCCRALERGENFLSRELILAQRNELEPLVA